MIVTDFIYDNVALNSVGYMICDFDYSGNNEIENATRTFQNVSMFQGKFMPFTHALYENRLEFSFDICKMDCSSFDDYYISNKEAAYMMRWLARPESHKLKFVHSDYADIYYDGSFNVTDIKFGDNRIGLRLTFITTRPFGSYEAVSFRKTLEPQSDELVITDTSDDAGYIYPYIEIVCNESGDLYLNNSYDNVDTIIKNCTEGEKIIFTEQLILSTDMIEHKVQNDFNYEFLKISNNFSNRTNRITSSLDCDLLISYCPIAKVVY